MTSPSHEEASETQFEALAEAGSINSFRDTESSDSQGQSNDMLSMQPLNVNEQDMTLNNTEIPPRQIPQALGDRRMRKPRPQKPVPAKPKPKPNPNQPAKQKPVPNPSGPKDPQKTPNSGSTKPNPNQPAKPKPTPNPSGSKDPSKPIDPFDADVQKFAELQTKLGSTEAVGAFLQARDTLSKARKETLPSNATNKDGKSIDNSKIDLKPVDLSPTDTRGVEVVAPKRPAGFDANYLDAGPWVMANIPLENPEELTPERWTTILQVNKAFHGFTLREKEKDVVKARFQAFQLSRPDVAQSTGSYPKAIKPEFEVFDSSSISISETETDMQKSLAENGFTSRSVETALSGGVFGISAGLSAGLRTSSSQGTASTNDDKVKEYFATYNFPRARLYVDELNLQVTPSCSADLEAILALKTRRDVGDQEAEAMLQKFSARYGHIFATQFQLGGQLQCTKFASATATSTEADRRDALKASVAASFSSAAVSGKGSYTYESQNHTNEQTQNLSNTSLLAWTARGGNTLLCANPPQWAATLATSINWRVIEQEQVMTLHDLLGRFPGLDKIPKIFSDIAQKKLEREEGQKPPPPPPVSLWTNKIELEHFDQFRQKIQKVYFNKQTGRLAVTSNENVQSAVLTVLNANLAAASSRDVPYFGADGPIFDFPMFLVVGDNPQRSPVLNSQWSGLWADDQAATLVPQGLPGTKIGRWSFRKVQNPDPHNFDSTTARSLWKPLTSPPSIIQNGDLVWLFCHSVDYGLYRDVNNTPYHAPRVMYNQVTDDYRLGIFQKPHRALPKNVVKQYDEGTMDSDSGRKLEQVDLLNTTFGLGEIYQWNLDMRKHGWVPAVFRVNWK